MDRPNLWSITAQYEHKSPDGFSGSVQVPTFLVNGDVQGFTDEAGAIRTARQVLTACVREMPVNDTLHIAAVKI